MTEEDGDEEVLSLDTRRGRYRRLLVRDGRLAGAILLGDLRDARALRELLRDGDEIPPELLDGPATTTNAEAAEVAIDPATTICSCQGVTHGEIEHAIRDRDLTTVEQVAELLNETFGATPAQTAHFTRLLYDWTRGNPFFLGQFLVMLVLGMVSETLSLIAMLGLLTMGADAFFDGALFSADGCLSEST